MFNQIEIGTIRQKFIERRGDKFCVTTQSGELIACHDTRKDALAQLRAIEANKGVKLKGPVCMGKLTDMGISEGRAHNICYADEIQSGKREPKKEGEE